MATKQELRARQDALLAVYDEVQAELMKIPGVVGVGVGLKEVDGKLTDQICFRVYVWAKKAAGEVPAAELIPSSIRGFPTDVLKVYELSPTLDFVERRDLSEHRPLKGGVAISTKIMTEHNEYGTLGWFATKVSDGSNVALTNAHVLYPDLYNDMPATVLTETDKLTQPEYKKTCCCEYHVIGERLIGIKNNDVDCALGRLNPDFPPALIIGNRATTRTLRVDGRDTAIAGETVRKIGARSGYTEGIVADIGGAAAGTMISLPNGQQTRVRPNQIIVWPVDTETYVDDHFGQIAFCNEGDSGSVLIDSENKIVGLVFSADFRTASRSLGIANHIDRVLQSLQSNGHEITLRTSPSGGARGILAAAVLQSIPSLNDLIRESPTQVAALVRRHRDEVASLIEHCRAVTVVWHRKNGPAFAAAVVRSHREPDYRIPAEIKGISRHELLLSMALALGEHGSPALQEDLRQHGLRLMEAFTRADNVHTLLQSPDQAPAFATQS